MLAALLVMSIMSPAPDRETQPPRFLAQPDVFALEKLTLRSAKDASDWTYVLTFNGKPNCPAAHRFTGPALCLVDEIESAQPSPSYTVKPEGDWSLTMVITADKAPAKPLVRTIERIRGDEVAYDVSFEEEPDADRIKLVEKFFLALAPTELILRHKEKDKPWRITVSAKETPDKKVMRYLYRASLVD
jgi:hypothetical protein